jgi:hypothetical protein
LKDSRYNKNTYKKEFDEDFYINKEYQLQRETNPAFKKYYTTKRKIKIYNLNKLETLGYGDCLLEEEKYFMSAKVISQHCHVFVLEINFLPSILKDYLISKNYSMTNIERKEIMMKRLRNIKITFLDKFLENNKTSYSVIDTVKSKIIKKGTANNFQISKTLINFHKNDKKHNEINEKILFTLKMKKKPNNNKRHSVIYNRKIIDNDNNTFLDKKIRKNNFLIQTEEELEKYKDRKNKSKTNLNLNKSIRCKTENKNNNKNNDASLPILKTIKSINKNKSKSRCVINKEFLTENRINKLIPKIPLLSKKLMFKDKGTNLYTKRNKKIGKMTQLDFLFYDFYFTERSAKKYSKQSLILDE